MKFAPIPERKKLLTESMSGRRKHLNWHAMNMLATREIMLGYKALDQELWLKKYNASHLNCK